MRSCSGYRRKSGERLNLDWTSGELAEGLRCYHSAQFFEAHEHWELVWLKSPEPEKTFLQGMIQMAAAFHHLQRGNLQGAASLLKQALGKLEGFTDTPGQVSVASLCAEIGEWLKELERNAGPKLAFPRIEVRHENAG